MHKWHIEAVLKYFNLVQFQTFSSFYNIFEWKWTILKVLLNRLSKCYDPSREVLPETRKPPPVKRTDQTAWRPDPKFSILTEKLFFLSLQFCFCWLAPVCLIFPNVPFEWAQTLKILKCQFFWKCHLVCSSVSVGGVCRSLA